MTAAASGTAGARTGGRSPEPRSRESDGQRGGGRAASPSARKRFPLRAAMCWIYRAEDILRLSPAMPYKSAAAGLPLDGGRRRVRGRALGKRRERIVGVERGGEVDTDGRQIAGEILTRGPYAVFDPKA